MIEGMDHTISYSAQQHQENRAGQARQAYEVPSRITLASRNHSPCQKANVRPRCWYSGVSKKQTDRIRNDM